MIQPKNAIATAASNLLQWFGPHSFKSLSMRTVIPAAEHAAANVIVDVTCSENSFQVKTEGSPHTIGSFHPTWHRKNPQKCCSTPLHSNFRDLSTYPVTNHKKADQERVLEATPCEQCISIQKPNGKTPHALKHHGCHQITAVTKRPPPKMSFLKSYKLCNETPPSLDMAQGSCLCYSNDS